MTEKIQFISLRQSKPERFPSFPYEVVPGTNQQVVISKNGDYFTWVPGGRALVKKGDFWESEKYIEYVRGFWVNTFAISKDNGGIYHSVPNAMPFKDAERGEMVEKIAEIFGGKMISDIQYLRILTWFFDSGIVSKYQVLDDSSEIGNYESNSIAITGENPEWMIGNIDCLIGNLRCWIRTGNTRYDKYLIAGGSYLELGENYPAFWFSTDHVVYDDWVPTQIRLTI